MYDNHLQFFTATILYWKLALQEDRFKDIIISSLDFLVKKERCKVFGFVIMPNHIHLLWQISEHHMQQDVQRDFLKFTSQQIKFKLQDEGSLELESFRVDAIDRQYQIWERNALSVDVWTPDVMWQKLNYIHNNPLQEKWQLAKLPEEYKYSSAKFYFDGDDDFGFLTHVND